MVPEQVDKPCRGETKQRKRGIEVKAELEKRLGTERQYQQKGKRGNKQEAVK